mmetsp:Transcript_26085/g.66216  ORF Transcript_26085/g.66216 Transcript_26085/m.66216 type:complete len:316 (+) Transcript_26085:3989-4936(+)
MPKSSSVASARDLGFLLFLLFFLSATYRGGYSTLPSAARTVHPAFLLASSSSFTRRLTANVGRPSLSPSSPAGNSSSSSTTRAASSSTMKRGRERLEIAFVTSWASTSAGTASPFRSAETASQSGSESLPTTGSAFFSSPSSPSSPSTGLGANFFSALSSRVAMSMKGMPRVSARPRPRVLLPDPFGPHMRMLVGPCRSLSSKANSVSNASSSTSSSGTGNLSPSMPVSSEGSSSSISAVTFASSTSSTASAPSSPASSPSSSSPAAPDWCFFASSSALPTSSGLSCLNDTLSDAFGVAHFDEGPFKGELGAILL